MNFEEQVIATLNIIIGDLSVMKQDITNLQQDVSMLTHDTTDIKRIQRLHTNKLDAISRTVEFQVDHSTNLSERVRELERKVVGI